MCSTQVCPVIPPKGHQGSTYRTYRLIQPEPSIDGYESDQAFYHSIDENAAITVT